LLCGYIISASISRAKSLKKSFELPLFTFCIFAALVGFTMGMGTKKITRSFHRSQQNKGRERNKIYLSFFTLLTFGTKTHVCPRQCLLIKIKMWCQRQNARVDSWSRLRAFAYCPGDGARDEFHLALFVSLCKPTVKILNPE